VTDLSTYAGQTINLDIVAATDEIFNSNLFIDDVTFQASPLTGTGVPQVSTNAPAQGTAYTDSVRNDGKKEQLQPQDAGPEAAPRLTR
jgi:hypothetical protein